MTSFGKRNFRQMVIRRFRSRRSLWGVSPCRMLLLR